MEWTQQVNQYCERLDPSFWAEPINAVTNLAFVIAAIFMWPRVRGLVLGQALTVLLALIGIGSFLFHTYAMIWSGVADVVPIVLFVLLYLYAAIVHFWNQSPAIGIVGIVLFFPYAFGLTFLFNKLPFFCISSFYWPIPILILGFAIALQHRIKRTSRGLAIGASILCVSLVARSLDHIVCPGIATGTHFLWHILNAVMLAWMIEVYRRHMLAAPAQAR